VDAGGIQTWVGLKNRFGGGAVFFGDGVDGFPGTDGMGGGGLGAERGEAKKNPEGDETGTHEKS